VSRAPLSAGALALGLLAGCSATVAGHAVRTPPSAVERGLPSSSELGRIFHLPIESDSIPLVGGMDAFRDEKDASSPPECSGVAHAGYRTTYQGAPVRAAARGFWTTPHGSDDRVSVVTAVVELDSPSIAQSWVAKTAAQWRHCQGVTVTERMSALSFIEYVNGVSDSDGTLTAVLSLSTQDGMMTPALVQRAFMATSRYLVDAEVFGTIGHPDASVLDVDGVARLVAGKLA
jgi:hypothetical protein